jgi:hypothetical protein
MYNHLDLAYIKTQYCLVFETDFFSAMRFFGRKVKSMIQSIAIRIVTFISLFLLLTVNAKAQESLYYTYYPIDIHQTEWKWRTHLFYQMHNNSDQITNEFAQAVYNSEYLSYEFKTKLLSKLNGSSYVNRHSLGEIGSWIRQDKLSYYLGLDFQQILDGRIDEDITKLLLMGNAPYAGEQLDFKETDYLNVYFNRIKLGLSKTLEHASSQHTFTGILAFTVGQNYHYTELKSGFLYTQEDGEYVELNIAAQTQMSDTVWGDLLTFAGYGAGIDFDYSFLKKQNYFLSIGVKNLGFINWSKAPFQSVADTNIQFSGIDDDSENKIPDDFSESTLRNLIFKNVDRSSFSKMLPYNLHLSAGKFFLQSSLYLGINAYYYPQLHLNYRAEFFLSWNISEALVISPLLAYNSFQKFNLGLSAETTLWKKLSLRVGSSYLNTAFEKASPLGQGFFLSLVFSD